MKTDRPGLLIVLSGPAGCGKTTVATRLVEEMERLERVVTATTRQPREGEVDGRDYHFLSVEDFEQQIAEGAFYEFAKVHGRYYGTLKAPVEQRLAAGADALLVIDVQGAASLREQASANPALQRQLCTVFIQPQSLGQLEERLRGRGSDDEAEIARRMATAREELQHAAAFNHCMMTTTREADFAALKAIYEAETGRLAQG